MHSRSCSYETRCRLRAIDPVFPLHPAVILPKWCAVFLSFCFPLSPFFERDFRLKKRSKCPSWRSPALCRPRCQGRAVCVLGSEADGVDRTSGWESALLPQEGQRVQKDSREVLCERMLYGRGDAAGRG